MKNYISNKTLIAGVALTVFVSVGIYITNDESIAVPANEKSTSLPSTVIDSNDATTTHTPVAEVADRDSGIEVKEQIDFRTEQEDFAILELNNRVQLTESELALPAPSGENVMAEATGEYADEVNPQRILQKAKMEGYYPPEVAPDSHPPGGNNVTSEPQGEYAHEVNQQALINKARLEGYLLPEVPPDSHPPSGENVSSKLQGENSAERIGAKSL